MVVNALGGQPLIQPLNKDLLLVQQFPIITPNTHCPRLSPIHQLPMCMPTVPPMRITWRWPWGQPGRNCRHASAPQQGCLALCWGKDLGVVGNQQSVEAAPALECEWLPPASKHHDPAPAGARGSSSSILAALRQEKHSPWGLQSRRLVWVWGRQQQKQQGPACMCSPCRQRRVHASDPC